MKRTYLFEHLIPSEHLPSSYRTIIYLKKNLLQMIESLSPRNELYDHIPLHHILIWTYMEKYLSSTRSFFKTCIPNFEPSNFILSNFDALRFRLDTATDSWLAPSGLHIKSNPQWKSECGISRERERERSQFISLISQFIPLVNISYL